MKNRKTLVKTLAITLSALMACTGIFTILSYIFFFASQGK